VLTWPASMWTARCWMSAAYCSTRQPGRSGRWMVSSRRPVTRYRQRTFICPSRGPRPSRERRPLRWPADESNHGRPEQDIDHGRPLLGPGLYRLGDL